MLSSYISYRYVFYSNFILGRKRKHARVSDASGSDAENNHSLKKKRSAVIGSGSEDSDASEAKESAEGKEPTGMVSHALLILGGNMHVRKTLGRPSCRQVR